MSVWVFSSSGLAVVVTCVPQVGHRVFYSHRRCRISECEQHAVPGKHSKFGSTLHSGGIFASLSLCSGVGVRGRVKCIVIDVESKVARW